MTPQSLLSELGIAPLKTGLLIGNQTPRTRGEKLTVHSPIDGQEIHQLNLATASDVSKAVTAANQAFLEWRTVPAPVRGELIRQYGNRLREAKQTLGALVSWEVGKVTSEAEGEVQEMIDICDFAVGLSRQLYGLTIASERPEHRLAEQWHPIGPVGIISAFNFPVAVWCWNSALALVCGNPVIWKPSEKAPLSALACHQLLMEVIEDFDEAPADLSSVVIGLRDAGEALAEHPSIPLVSATGSVVMGKSVAATVGARLGKSLLELGGNNAMILTPSADLDLAIRAIVFAAVGTAGQRCTSLRRLIIHQSIHDEVIAKLKTIYKTLPIGNPMDEGVLVGPLIDEDSALAYEATVKKAKQQGGKIHHSGREKNGPAGGAYVKPALIEIDANAAIVQHETFAPILYLLSYTDFDEAITIQNGVPQGLSSAIFTSDIREAEKFCGPAGSDCGIANVNIGTSGAEIGGAFGGEKETGGGRESGSDSWKNYMRRATNTINYSDELPLAQGIEFDL